jgi:hypothetical protein
MQSNIWWAFCLFVLAVGVDSMLLKVDNSLLDQSSMVAENLQRIEKQDEVSKPMLETALKDTAVTALIGE